MKSYRAVPLAALTMMILTGCETTSTIPYSTSTENVLKFQDRLSESGVKVKLGEFTQSPEVEKQNCRLAGPVDVSPGKTQSQYIKEAIQKELFMAQVYDIDSTVEITGNLDAVKFRSVSPASWTINFAIKSNESSGYSIETVYPFKTSFSAYSACKNVANAWAPAIQTLIDEIIEHPGFGELVGL